jgi:F-type H+-transporting ATPase subunit b
MDMLKFSWPAFGFAIVNFLLLTALLWKLLHKPLLSTLDKRQESIDKERELAESETRKAAEAKAEYEAKLKDAAAESDQLLADARRTAQETADKLMADAAEKAKQSTAALEQADQRERREAQSALQRSVADCSLNIAAAILAKLSDDDIEDKLAAGVLKGLDGLATDGESVSITEAAEVRVTSAGVLADGRRSEILQRIQKLGGAESSVEFVVDESLVAGVRVEFSDRVVDGSLSDILARAGEALDFSEAPEVSEGEGDS